MPRSGLAFVASNLDITGIVPITIMPGFVLRAARLGEIDDVRQYLDLWIPPDTKHWVAYAHAIKAKKVGSTTTYTRDPLPLDKWKYWVIAFDGDDETFQEIELIGQLLPFHFDIAFVQYYSEPDQQGSVTMRRAIPPHIVEKYGSFEQASSNAEIISSALFDVIETDLDAYRNLDSKSFIRSSLRNFAQLRRISEKSDLVVVALFAVLESLITHKPCDNLDSLRRQVSSKMKLLEKKYRQKVNGPQYGWQIPTDTLWKRLYDFRSAVAHGEDGISYLYKIHSNRETVISYVRESIKQALILALHEPVFVSDLKEC